MKKDSLKMQIRSMTDNCDAVCLKLFCYFYTLSKNQSSIMAYHNFPKPNKGKDTQLLSDSFSFAKFETS